MSDTLTQLRRSMEKASVNCLSDSSPHCILVHCENKLIITDGVQSNIIIMYNNMYVPYLAAIYESTVS